PVPAPSTLFPYPTLFRSESHAHFRRLDQRVAGLTAGLGRIADSVANIGQTVMAAAAAVSRLEAAVKSRSALDDEVARLHAQQLRDRKSTRLNSSHLGISY